MGATGLEIGLLVTAYSVLQLFMAPFWGRLSDRMGRKPILIVGLFGSALAYAVFAFSHSLTILLASRLLAGLGGSTIPVAQAYIADITPPEGRAGRMGFIGAAFGLGFIIGPALGGILATRSFEAPGLTAAGICLAGGIVAAILLKESLPPQARSSGTNANRWSLRDGLKQAASPGQLRSTLITYLLLTAAFATLQPTLSLLAGERFGMDARGVGYLFALLGVVSVIVQGGLVRRLVPRIGEKRLLMLSVAPFALGLIILGAGQTIAMVQIGVCLIGAGYGGAIPCALALLSRAGSEAQQGAVLGIGQSVGSVGRILGPLLAGALFDVKMALPYLAGAVLVCLAGAASLSLTQPSAQTRATTP